MAETDLKNVEELLKTRDEVMTRTRGISMPAAAAPGSGYCGNKKAAISA